MRFFTPQRSVQNDMAAAMNDMAAAMNDQVPEADVDDGGSESPSRSDSGEHPLLQRLRRTRESVPASAWDDVPSDGGKNYKHYLYGHPKAD